MLKGKMSVLPWDGWAAVQGERVREEKVWAEGSQK